MQKKLTTSALGGRSDSIIPTIGNNLLKTAHPDLKSSSIRHVNLDVVYPNKIDKCRQIKMFYFNIFV